MNAAAAQSPSPRRPWIGAGLPYAVLIVVVLVHRIALYMSLRDAFDVLLALHPDHWTWQLLPVALLRDDLATALLYLQQNPPLPQVLAGIVLKAVATPAAAAHVLLAVQGALTLIAALLLQALLARIGMWRWPALLLALLFALSGDVILLEYNSFGQTFYENLCMPLVLGAVWLFLDIVDGRRGAAPWGLGLLVAALALTRASFGYFFLPVTLALLVARVGPKALLAFLLPVVLLQGGWALKNQILYGYFSLPATSWTGANLAVGVFKRSGGDDTALRAVVLEHPRRYPAWFVAMTREKGIAYWQAATYGPYIPADIRVRDADIARALPGNPEQNSLAQAVVARHLQRAVRDYAIAHPAAFAAGVAQSYRQFWQPIRDYTARFAALLFVARPAGDIWSDGGLRAFARGDFDDYWVLQRTRALFLDDSRIFSGCLHADPFALPYAPLLVYLYNVAALHALGPLLLVAAAWLRRDAGERGALAFLYLVFLYGAVVSSIGDHGENNRFRLAIEPLIWLLGAAIALGWLRLWRSRGAVSAGRVVR